MERYVEIYCVDSGIYLKKSVYTHAMKRIWYFIILVIVTGCLVDGLNAMMSLRSMRAQQELSTQVIRFHVRANSDSLEDQKTETKG